MIWDAVIGGIFKTLDKIIPDPVERAEAKRKLAEMEINRELEFLKADVNLALEQVKVNAAEATNPSVFVSGWRPAAGWVCVLGFAYMVLIRPILPWLVGLLVPTPVDPMPEVELGDLTVLLFGMLGLTASRTVEKLNGVAAR